MINIKLAMSYLKKQKGKTLSLILSIGIAVILVFSLSVIKESQGQSDINHAYKNSGDYHAFYEDVDSKIVKKLNSEEDIKKFNDVLKFGEIVSKDNGSSINLCSYNKNFLDSTRYKLIKGREPRNSNELVIEQKVLDKMKLDVELNQTIDFQIVNEYVNKNNENSIYSKDKQFKIVGILSKPDEYYEGLNEYKVRAFTYSKDGKDIVPYELTTHMGTLKLNTKDLDTQKVVNLGRKYKLTSNQFYPNTEVSMSMYMKNISKKTTYSIKQSLLPLLCATLVIYNMFNIIILDMTKQIGLLRAVGASKRNIRQIFFIQSIVVLSVGIVIGLLGGIVFSYLGLMIVYDKSAELIINTNAVIESIIMSIIAVILASVVPVYKAGNLSIIDAIKKTDKLNYIPKLLLLKSHKKVVGIINEIAFKNIFRNKVTSIIIIITISLCGVLFIGRLTSTKFIYGKESDSANITSKSYGNFGIYLGYSPINANYIFSKYDNSLLNEIKAIDDVTDIEPNIYLKGYLRNADLKKDYLDELKRTERNNTNESTVLIRGYNKELLNNIDKYIDKGENVYSYTKGDYKNILLVNNFYSRIELSNNTQIIKSPKVGDLIDIKTPVYKDGEYKYINIKVRIAGIMKNSYISEQDGESQSGGIQVIFNEKDLKELTGINDYNKAFVKIKKGTDKKVIKEITNIIEKSGFSDIEGRYVRNHFGDHYNKSSYKLAMICVFGVLLISSINIIFIVRSNIIVRLSEICTFRAVGMSKKNVKRMLIKENIIYGVLSMLMAGIISSFSYYKMVSETNKLNQQIYGISNSIKFEIPIYEILIFGLISVFVCVIAVYFSNKMINKLSIVSGIKENE
ncbi:TPA: ABC transporter permease [Clostridioides difficile]|uniref:ABC transporter permease n=2 Tax=Clostridioides difficile TaxID=1496 RepID=UPI00097FDAD2|nr:ABC transporter permease [Clostridioides difficile]SJP50145.1 acidobacterial duplicated orphan permease [Clostridioides difficile]HBG4072748.1 ABC transporter permease [Clostridioides difficile]